jgi:carbamoyltransferase
MIILGISDSHEAHACIYKNGKIIAAISEERLSRLKSDQGYPKKAIDKVLEISGIVSEDLDLIAVAGQSGNLLKSIYKQIGSFTVEDWVEQCDKIWRPVLLEGKKYSHFEDFDLFKSKNSCLHQDPYLPLVDVLRNNDPSNWFQLGQDFRRDVIAEHIGVDRKKIEFFRHEDCHKWYGYFSSPKRHKDSLILTLEGGGDDSAATVSTVSNGNLTEHWKSIDVSIARLYRYVTLILGMKPGQHEYKVMGLAPYGDSYQGQRSLEFFRKINVVEGEKIINTKAIPDLYYSVKDVLRAERFDGIAWGLQEYTEEILGQWVSNCIRKYGISDVVISGGVAQNIKACMSLMNNPDVASIWAGPISGDGSLAIGAVWAAANNYKETDKIVGLDSIYLGTSVPKLDALSAMKEYSTKSKDALIENISPMDVAKYLADGKIVARMTGAMEFGQRALGNRSILADPRSLGTVERINRKIKNRDFWMPFTPTILSEYCSEYIENPKKIASPFMTMAFDTCPGAASKIPAAVHPSDKTARPQMLKKDDNEGYYNLIECFHKITGVPVLLNTSFNLHGEAIVETVDDALYTFENSDIDVLIVNDIALVRSDLQETENAK